MFRLFLSFQACWLVAALAQPIDARDSLIRPSNPPQPLNSQSGALLNLGPSNSPQTLNSQSGTSLNLAVQKAPPAPATFKITEAKFDDDASSSKRLKVAISKVSLETPDASQMQVYIFFYETDASGKAVLSESAVIPQWTTSPVDWSDGTPEELTFSYTAPLAESGKKFAGYIFEIYYKDQLQDSRTSSPDLFEKLALQSTASGAPAAPTNGSVSQTGEPDRYLLAYKSFKEAEKSFESGDVEQAKGAVATSVSILTQLQQENPNWQPQIVDYRLSKAKQLEEKINSK